MVLETAEQAFEVFRPDGQLNDRAWGAKTSRMGFAPASLRRGPRFVGFFQAKEAFTFLDRLHDQLARTVAA